MKEDNSQLAQGVAAVLLALLLAFYATMIGVAGIILFRLFHKGLISLPDLIIVSFSALFAVLFIKTIYRCLKKT